MLSEDGKKEGSNSIEIRVNPLDVSFVLCECDEFGSLVVKNT